MTPRPPPPPPPPFIPAEVGSVRHPALGGGRRRQVALPLQQLLVLGVVAQPAQQRLAGVAPHADVGQAHRQSHQGREVVGVELQTPGTGWGGGGREAPTLKANSHVRGVDGDRPKTGNIRRVLMVGGGRGRSHTSSCLLLYDCCGRTSSRLPGSRLTPPPRMLLLYHCLCQRGGHRQHHAPPLPDL